MKTATGLRATVWAFGFVAVLSLGVSAERAWVGSRSGSDVQVWDTAAPLPPTATNTITVGAGPIDIASDEPDSAGPLQVYVVCSGSNSVSVISPVSMFAFATISSDGFFGTFDTPSGIARMASGSIGPALAVVDHKVTPPAFGPSGRSTVRFIDPNTNRVVDAFRETSGSARYNGVAFTSNGSNTRLWIADDGDMGVVVIKFPQTISGPPFSMGDTILYGSSGFADFIFDTAATPTFLKAPRRLATDGVSRVVAADAGSNNVTVLDANYVPAGTRGEPGAILGNVSLGAGSGNCVDVKIIGSAAFVTTTAAQPANNLFRVNLDTLAVDAMGSIGGAGQTVAGLGRTADGTKLFVGDATGGGLIARVDVATFPAVDGTFTLGGTTPFPFYSSGINPNAPDATVSGGQIASGRLRGSSSCGLVGLEAVLLLAFLRVRRRA